MGFRKEFGLAGESRSFEDEFLKLGGGS